MNGAAELDLFGEPITAAAARAKPRRKRKHGYAAAPGSGPAGETCRSCEHYARVGGHAKIYRKCALKRFVWTNGPGTDIKASAPVCSHWEARQP